MEFAITLRAGFPGADDSWLPRSTRSFSSVRRWRLDWRHIAIISDWGVWSDRNAGEVRVAGAGADQNREHVSLRHAGDQSDGLFFSGIDRADFAEPYDCATGMADGHHGWILRGLHDIFEFWMGNGKDAGGGRVVVGDGVCGGQRGVRGAAFGGGDPAGEPVLGKRFAGTGRWPLR